MGNSYFQKRHYETIGKVIRDSLERKGHIEDLIENLISLFRNDNSLFDENRFRSFLVPRSIDRKQIQFFGNCLACEMSGSLEYFIEDVVLDPGITIYVKCPKCGNEDEIPLRR